MRRCHEGTIFCYKSLMRCGMCGVEARRGERMVSIAGFGVCQACVTLASDLHAGAGGTVEEIAVALGRHIHRTNVVLPDGTTVTAVSFVEDDAYGRDRPPDFGLYLDPRWAPPWEHEHLDWPDFDIPADKDAALDRLKLLLERARQGQRVEIGCLGAHGRTGTALACLAVLTGHPANDAVRWVRDNYCADAVETVEQREFVAQLDD